MFQYKSVYMISFHAEPSRSYPLHTVYFSSPDWVDTMGGASIRQVKIEHERKSNPGTTFPLLKINYNLAKDKEFAGTKKLIRTFLADIKLPSRIYVSVHGEVGLDYVLQWYQEHEGYGVLKDYFNRIYCRDLCEIFCQALPERLRHDITFHLVVCQSSYFGRHFAELLSQNGFNNFFVTAYTNYVLMHHRVGAFRRNREVRMADFSTVNRKFNLETKTAEHHSSNPDLPDNKVIFFKSHGRIEEQPYRKFISENSAKLAPEYRKNFFAYAIDEYEQEFLPFVETLKSFLYEELINMCGKFPAKPPTGKSRAGAYFTLYFACALFSESGSSQSPVQIRTFLCRTLTVLAAAAQLKGGFFDRRAAGVKQRLENFYSDYYGLVAAAMYGDEKKLISSAAQRSFNLKTVDAEGYLSEVLQGNIPVV